MSMQVHHVRFPPQDSTSVPQQNQPQQPGQQQQQSTALTQAGAMPPADSMRSLTRTRLAQRLPPGFFLDFVQRNESQNDVVFIAAPDSGRIAKPQDQSQTGKLHETGMWVHLESHAEDIGETTPAFSASPNPQGFGNELAVQFDQPVTELAVLTNTGVHTFRRRRMVDIFAMTIRYGGGGEGLEGEIKAFVRRYGRGETMATALAVACGQAAEVTADSRVTKITDTEVIDYARRTFVDHGGNPILDQNTVIDPGANAVEYVKPSPRHEGLALYLSRILRSVWKAPILVEQLSPAGLQVVPALPLTKLHDIQRDLTRLSEWLEDNKTFIQGLAGPEAMGRVATKQDEIALQGEHRALTSLKDLVKDVIEGIAFVLVLFDERVEEIVISIGDAARQEARQTTYEQLFCTQQGKELAKELVKAIVERNIRAGSNVDTVTDALRRRCGSFCSADDCVIFKAQEQLKRASDTGASSETSRNLLNESLRLLQKVSGSLTMDQLRYVTEQYTSMEFFAGAVQLALSMAQEQDPANRALAWINEGMPAQDPRTPAHEARARCYDLIHTVISSVDQTAEQAPEMVDGQYTTTAKRKREAYDVINNSTDEVFQINLFDWYLAQGWNDRLLEIESRFVVQYLERKAQDDVAHADLLCRYFAQYGEYLRAAEVQLSLAKGPFNLKLEERIEYLSRGRTNASTRASGVVDYGRARQSRQELIREISDLLDIANIQGDVLQRMKGDERLPAERRPQVLQQLNQQILPIDELYNGYADQASYFDLCLLIYQVADYRSPTDIAATWKNLLEQLHANTEAAGSPMPYEKVSEEVRTLGRRLNLRESTFPIRKFLHICATSPYFAVSYHHTARY